MRKIIAFLLFLLVNVLNAQQYYPQWGRVLHHEVVGLGPLPGHANSARASILDDTTVVLATSGLVSNYNTSEWRIYLINREGDVLLDSIYFPGSVSGVATISPDSFVVIGSRILVGEVKPFAALLNRSGDLLWEKTFNGSLEDSFEDVALGNDQSIVIAGTSKSSDGDFSINYGGSDVWIFKLDYQGNVLTSANHGHPANETEPKITQALGNVGYVVSANSDSSAFGHYLFSVDETLTNLWEKTFANINSALNIARSESAQSYYITQKNKTYPNPEYVLRVNATGDSLVQVPLGTFKHSESLKVNSKGEVFIGAVATNKDTLEAQFGDLWLTNNSVKYNLALIRFDSSLTSKQTSLVHNGNSSAMVSFNRRGGGVHLWNDSTVFFSSVLYTGTATIGKESFTECYLFTPTRPYTPDSVISSGITKDVLFLGSSYTFENGFSGVKGGIPNVISHIARSVGDSLAWDRLFISDYFYNILPSDPLYDSVAAKNYDYVSLQSNGYESFAFTDNAFYTSSIPALQHISDTIFQINPCTQSLVYMVWGDYFQEDDFETIYRRYNKLRSSTNLGISPVAKVFDEINKRNPYNNLVNWGDGYHPLVEGSFATALTMYTIMYQRDPRLMPNNMYIPAESFEIITSVVKEFVYDSLDKWGNNIHDIPVADFDYVQQGDSIFIQNNALNYNTISWFLNGVEQTPPIVTPVFVIDSLQISEITMSIQNECLSDSASHTEYFNPTQLTETPSGKAEELHLLTLGENLFAIQAPFDVAQVVAYTVLGQEIPLMVRGIGSEQVRFQIPGFVHEELIVLSIWNKNDPNHPHTKVLLAK